MATKTMEKVTEKSQKIDYWALIAESSMELARSALAMNHAEKIDPDTVEDMNSLISAMSILLMMGCQGLGSDKMGLNRDEAAAYIERNFSDAANQDYVKLVKKTLGL